MASSSQASALDIEVSGMREIARHTSQVIFSTLAIQVTTFALLAIAGRILPIELFARLSLIVAATMLSTVFFDLGLGLTATKHYGETKDEAYLRTAFAVWLLEIPAGAVLAACVWLLSGMADQALGVILGCVLNVWNGVRVADQARQDYESFTRASVAFAVIRLIAGFSALFATHDPFATAFALFAVPIVIVPFSSSFKYAASSLTGTRKPITEILGYVTHAHLAALAFVAATYLPQYFAAGRFDSVAVGTLGLIITFSAPVALVSNALRSVLLPKMLGRSSKLENGLWSLKGLLAIFAAWAVLMIGAFMAAVVLDRIYGARFPDIFHLFIVFFGGYSLSNLIGLYSLSIHTLGIPHYGMVANIARLAILAALLFAFGHSLMSIVAVSAITMAVAEALLAVSLLKAFHR